MAGFKDVKQDIFGTRTSRLISLFDSNGISTIKGIWLVTCRRAVNPDPNSRYLLLLEGSAMDDTSIFSPHVPLYSIAFADNIAELRDLRTQVRLEFTRSQLKHWILEMTGCEYIQSSALGGTHATKLSKFVREHMGSAIALTDLDFLIMRKRLFVEEKTFVNDGHGYLGEGQYYSFAEFLRDVAPDCKLYIVFATVTDFYLRDFAELNPVQKVYLPKWGSMFRFPVGNPIAMSELLELCR